MRRNKLNFIFIILFSLVFFCSCSKRPLDFIYFESKNSTTNTKVEDDSKTSAIFLVDNFVHTKKNERIIDSFACRYLMSADFDSKKYVTFYKTSKFTNIEYLTKHPLHFEEGDWINNIESSEKSDYLWLYEANKLTGKLEITKSHGGSSRMSQKYKNFYYPDCKCSSNK